MTDKIKEIGDKALAKLGFSSLEKNRIGRASGPADVDRMLVALMIANIEEGYVRMPVYLDRPMHFPDHEEDLRKLWISTAARDQTIRTDMREWRAINRRVCDQAAVSLKNMIAALRVARAVNAATSNEDDEMVGWEGAISSYLRYEFKIDVPEIPETLNIEAWCFEKLAEFSPVPTWLRDPQQTKLFSPQPSALGAMTRNNERKDDGE